MIPNLNPEQDLRNKRGNASLATVKATKEQDALQLYAVANLWDEIGEKGTAEKCRNLAQMIAGIYELKRTVEESSRRDEFIVPK